MALKVWLPLNGSLENKGISDVTVTNNGATVDNNGKIGKCYSFDGSNDYLLGNYSPFTNNSEEWSFACWFKPNTAHNGCLFSARTATAATGISIFYYTSQFLIDDGVRWQFTPSVAVKVGEWNHLVVTRKAGIGKNLFLNGQLVNTTTTTGTPTSVCTTHFAIGNSQNSATSATGNPFNGLINDVRIYDHCLSSLEVKEISQGLVLHYKLDGSSGGVGENLAFAPTTATNFGSSNELRTITFSGWDAYAPLNLNLTAAEWNTMVGQKITYSCWMKNIEQTAGTGTGIMLHVRYVDGTYQQYGGGKNGTSGSYLAQGESGWLKLTITIPDPTARTNPTTISHVQFSIRHNSSSGASTVQYQYAKVEKGNQQTAWSPAPEDLDIDTTKIKDSSGYENDGIQNNIITSLDTPRYLISSQFNGTDSYIKVSNNNWMAQGMEALTVNLWTKATTWPTNGGRLLSCTETGGFNLEGGSSGYWRFPIHVYTNAEKTSTAYKYDSKEIQISALIPDDWNMITLVYDTTGTKTYINGQLHHTYTNTSYGIHFNTNARLFLGCEANTASPGGNYFNGQESDFRLYVTALSAEDIATLYHTPAQIDNLQNAHMFEAIEDNNVKVEKNGIFRNQWSEGLELKTLSDGSIWAKLYYFDYDIAGSIWTPEQAKWCNSEGKYSCLGDLEKFIPESGWYEFWYTEKIDGSQFIRWKQSYNPLSRVSSGAGGTASEYTFIDGTARSNFTGLTRYSSNDSTYCYLRGVASWWGAIAPYQTSYDVFPTMWGSSQTGNHHQELWINITENENISRLTANEQSLYIIEK